VSRRLFDNCIALVMNQDTDLFVRVRAEAVVSVRIPLREVGSSY